MLDALNESVEANEESVCEHFDEKWDDLVADEVLDWTFSQLALTVPGLAHARIELGLRTYRAGPDQEDNDDYMRGMVTVVPAFIRIVLSPQIRVDRFELKFECLADWITHDAIRFVDDPGTH